VGNLLALTLALPTAACVVALLLLGLPALLSTLLRATAEVAGNATWVPAARRYALGPALATLAPLTGALFAGTWLAANAAGWQHTTLTAISLGAFQGAVTLRGVALFLALALPYLLLLDLPYRLGIWRWRRAWLNDLTTRRADVESHVRRLSAPDMQSGAQNTSEQNLRAMQYDLVLLQFYKDKIAEAERTPAAPFRLPGSLFALAVALLGALLLDTAAVSLANLLVR
jgi:hypothetical protein